MEENQEYEVFTDEELRIKTYEEVTEDVKLELDFRMENLKVFYPYFEFIRRLKIKEESFGIDFVGISMAVLSFLLQLGKLSNKKIEYIDICDFTDYFIRKAYNKEFEVEKIKEIVSIVLDEMQNKGTNFTFDFYSLLKQDKKEKHIKYIEIKLSEDGKFQYYITSQGIDFYLKTKEFPDETQITINLLLFRKQIEKGSFNYAYDTVKRLNIEVKRKIEQKNLILEGLMYGGKEGIENYYKYHDSVKLQFNEEEELFLDVTTLIKNLYTQYIEKEGTNSLGEKEKKTLSLIRKIEKELNKAVSKHSTLLKEAVNMTKKYDEINDMRRKSAFSQKFGFDKEFEKVIKETNNPENLKYFITPFLLPKRIKTFNPMKSLSSQKIYINNKPEEESEKIAKNHQIETIDELTKRRVINNFNFYFNVILSLLEKKEYITIEDFANFIKRSYGDNYLYNGDFIAFVIYLNGKEIDEEFNFEKIKITTEDDDIDLGNGLKITNLKLEKGERNGIK